MTALAPAFSDTALTLLCKRYLRHSPFYPMCPECALDAVPNHICDGRHETVDQFLDRISTFGHCTVEAHGHTAEQAARYREMFARLDFLPNSPTLFNVGLGGTCSACFTFVVQDSLMDEGGIMAVAAKAAGVQKFGGGVGFGLSNIRAKGTPISSTHGTACGPVSVARHYNDVARLITQGGKRDGANIAILSVEHPDILEFIHMKDGTENLPPDDPRSMANFNISVGITDAFMEKAQRGHDADVAGQQLLAAQEDLDAFHLMGEMAQSAWRSGDPGVFFLDTVNNKHYAPQLGPIEACNPCGEVPQLDNEACTLGSINLAHMVLSKENVDWVKLAYTTELAVRYLDEVLDHDTYPDQAITAAVALTRKIGLGVCGWADMLAMMGIPYASEQAIVMAGAVMKEIQYSANNESNAIAVKKEPFPAWVAGLPRRRNATVTCIAPTGTIAQLMGASSGIEPHFALSNTRRMGDGTMLDEVAGDFGNFIPQTAMEIDWRWHVKMQAAFQEHTDLAVSKTINMPESATVQDIFDAYVEMWRSGCKGGTVYRNNSRNLQTLTVPKAFVIDEDWADRIEVAKSMHTGRRKPPRERSGRTIKFEVGEAEGYLTAGEYEDGSLAEIFLNVSKQGSTVDGLYDAIAMLTSFGLQYGVPLSDLAAKFTGVRFEPAGLTHDPAVPIASSVLDYLFRKLEAMYGPGVMGGLPAPVMAGGATSGVLCPDCGSETIHSDGCLYCTSATCGWTRC